MSSKPDRLSLFSFLPAVNFGWGYKKSKESKNYLLFISFVATKETKQRKMLDGVNAFRLVPRLHLNGTPSIWNFFILPLSAEHFFVGTHSLPAVTLVEAGFSALALIFSLLLWRVKYTTDEAINFYSKLSHR